MSFRLRALVASAATVAMLAVACGDGGRTAADRRRAGAGPPAATATADAAGGDGRSGSSSGATAAPGDGGTPGPGSTPTPRPTAPSDVILPPQAERYTYAVTGQRWAPGADAAQPYPDGAVLVMDHARTVPTQSWVEITYNVTLEADGVRGEETIAFRRAGLRRVGFERLRDTTAFRCRFEPQIAYANAPLKPETYPRQEWTGTGCAGSSEFRVVRKAEVTDASGKTWEGLWLIEERTEYRYQTVSGTFTATHWFSHDQGVDIRTDLVDEGTEGTSAFRYERTLLLAEMRMPESRR